MSAKDNKGKKKLNLKDIKERITDDSLDLSVCSLEAVPVKEISEQTKVRKLNLSYNLLVTLPDDFIKLQYIRELDLSKNKLRTLPKNFGALTNLKNLDLLGNELTTLPSTFSELKSLQWLDLKDNPLEEGLKKVAGDCLNEAQCKKCAANVIAYMKQVAIEEERRRQIELKKKRDEQAKKDAEEKEKAEQLRAQKKLEREQRRLVNEQKKQMIFHEGEHNGNNGSTEANGHATKRIGNGEKKSHKSTKSSGLISLVFFILFLAVSVALVFLLFSSYCEGGNKDFRKSLREKEWLRSVLGPIDGTVCPFVIQNRPIIRNYIKPLEFF